MHKTGDINKNIEKLKMELKQIRYPDKTDFDAMTSGNPLIFLPIVHYTLLSYSKFVAQFLLDNDYELFSKNDYDFISNVFHALINLLNFKPTISPKQFFSNGFAEGKVLFCIDVIRVIKQEHSQLVKKAYSVQNVGHQSGKNNAQKSTVRVDNNRPSSRGGERSPDRKNYEQNTNGNVNNTTGNDAVNYNFNKNIKVINHRKEKDPSLVSDNNNFQTATSPKFSDDIDISYKRSCSVKENNIVANRKEVDVGMHGETNNFKMEENIFDYGEDIPPVPRRKNPNEKPQQQKAGIEFSTLVEVLNTLANSVKEMTGKIEAFKTNIEARMGKIEAEMTLMKNRLIVLETSNSMPKQNVNKLSESPSNTNSNEYNEHIFSFATEDVHNSCNSNNIISPSVKEIHTAEYADNASKRFNNQNNPNPNMKKQEAKEKGGSSFTKNTNKILSEIEETDSLIERVEKRFKETQKLLNEFK